MTNLIDIIKSRRSIRNFQKKIISEEILNELMTSARWSPSWGNSQCWELILIDDEQQKTKLTKILIKKNPATIAVNNAPIVIAICAKMGQSGFYKGEKITSHENWFMYDLGILTQNICLTAHDLGLGTVIIGGFDHQQANEILNIPQGFDIISLLPVGYPAHSPSPTSRREISDFVHINYFNKNRKECTEK